MPSDPPTSAQPSGSLAVDFDVYCPKCDYNLRGLTVERCPECGEQFDLGGLMVSRIAWPSRGEMGAFRAYWRTVWLVTSQTSRFCDELIHPASYKDAQRFRWITILHACLPFLLTTIALYAFPPSWPSGGKLVDQGYDLVWPVVTLNVGIVLVLAAITGVPSYFLQSKSLPVERQNRVVALSYYACAPLAWIPLGSLLVVMVPLMESTLAHVEDMPHPFAVLAITATALGFAMAPSILAIWLGGLVGLARRTLRERPWRVWMMGLLLPVVWAALAVLIPGSMILSVAYVVLVFGSLR